MKFIKKIIMSCLLLYTYNLLAIYVNLVVPINLLTILFISLFDIPGFLILVFFKTFI